MSLRTAGPTLWLLAVTLAIAGCRRDIEAESRAEREANATKVTADSTDDATAPIVNEDFRFRIAPPGPGWKLMREHDARSLNPDAIAGAIHTADGTYGIVIVEPLPGTTLEQAVGFLWQEPLPGLEIESEQDLEFQGVPAKRRVFSAKIQGQTFHYVTTVLVRQDYLYQLMSWSMQSHELPSRLAFHDAVELLDGEIHGRRSSREPVTHADGIGWRIRDGRYESALSGLRMRLPDGWRFLVGTELELLESDAEIVATQDTGNVFLALMVSRASASRLPALAELTRQGFLDGQPPVGDPITRELADQRVEFRYYQTGPLEYQNGVHLGDDAITSVLAWYPQALREGAAGSLDAALAGIERIPESERAALHEQLLAAPNRQRRFTADRAFRAGEFLDFAHQLRWTMPSGFWSIDDFDKALGHSAETVLSAVELEHGVYVAVEVFAADGNQPADILAVLIEGSELVSRDTVVVDGLTIHRAQAIDRTIDPPPTYSFALTGRDGQIISLAAWSLDDSPASRATMQSAIAGLDYAPAIERTRIVGPRYTDVLYGFSFDVPVDFVAPPSIRSLGLGQVTSWAKGQQELVSLVMSGVTDDEQWMSSFFEQILRDTFGAMKPLGKPERSENLLGGHPARQLTWTVDGVKLYAQIVARDSQIYAMVYANLTDTQREKIQASWTLLE